MSYIVGYPLQTVVALFLFVPAYHLLAWLLDGHGLRSIPGPKLAAMSDAWLGYWAAQGCRSLHVHDMHGRYGVWRVLVGGSFSLAPTGKFVRIAPDHVSISDPDALQQVYAHGNGTTKVRHWTRNK